MRSSLSVCLALAALISIPFTASADEGQWMPTQIPELGPALKKAGLKVPPDKLWGPDGGLMRAAVNLSGCSAAFISKDGLIATNHHCAYGAIQAASAVEHDYLKQGFAAADRASELQGRGLRVQVLDRITDVTAEVRKAVEAAEEKARKEGKSGDALYLARTEAVEQTTRALVKACEDEAPRWRCQVASFYKGALFQLHRAMEISDVRLVFAPPSAIGNYGGEVDNWMWPRHTGDFTLVRAYVGPDGVPAEFDEANVPFKPRAVFPISTEGVDPGDFVATLGYPGRTRRYLTAKEVKRHLEQVFPTRIELFGQWIDLLKAAGARGKAVSIKVAARQRGLANVHKNARGMVEGIQRMGLLARREQEETAVRAWLNERKEDAVLSALEALSDEKREVERLKMLLWAAQRLPGTLGNALYLLRRAREGQKPDLERSPDYMDRSAPRLKSRIKRHARDFDPAVDAALVGALIDALKALPKSVRPEGLPRKSARALVKRSKFADDKQALAWFEARDLDAIMKSRDPMLALAVPLADAVERMEAQERAEEGQMIVLGPRYFEALKATRKGLVYPDANGTLRMSYAHIKGYSPRDGLWAVPQTTLDGLLSKHTGADPFDVPEPILKAAPTAKESPWADADLDDIPVCFLSTSDTTGGNSGSPVIDAQGRLVGLNFDRVWENIAGDFGYNTARSRNVIVDVRYLLWLVDSVYGAKGLLKEIKAR